MDASRPALRWGVFGGSFDPIHQGHIEPVRHVQRALGLQRVLYLPTASPPHKARELASASARYAMVELALLDDHDLIVSDLEMDPAQAPHYSVHTAERLGQLWPDVEFTWILGADSLLSFHTWHRWRDLATRVRVAAMVRPGWHLEPPSKEPPSTEPPSKDSHQVPGTSQDVSPPESHQVPGTSVTPSVGKAYGSLPTDLRTWIESDGVCLVENPGVAVSSTDIRRRLAEAGDQRAGVLRELVDGGCLAPRVGRYLEKYPLYAAATGR